MVDVKKGDVGSNIPSKINSSSRFSDKGSSNMVNKKVNDSKIVNPNNLVSSRKIDSSKINLKNKKTGSKEEEEKSFIPANYNPHKVAYPEATKKSFVQTLKEIIPPEFVPTEVMGYVFGGLFLFVMVLSLFFVPYNQIFSGNITNVNLTVGLPMHFVNLQLEHPEEFPVKGRQILGLLVDALIFLLIAFIVNVIFNYIKKAPVVLSDRDKGKYPRLYNVQKPTYAERITEKVFEDDKPKDKKDSSEIKTPAKNLNNRPVKNVVSRGQVNKNVQPQKKNSERIGKPASNPNKLNLKPVKPADEY